VAGKGISPCKALPSSRPARHGSLRRLFVRGLPGTPAFQRLCGYLRCFGTCAMLASNQQQGVFQPFALGHLGLHEEPHAIADGTHHMLFDGGFADIHMRCCLGMAEAIDAHQHKHLAALARHGLQAP
jgi:hypothetical protein